MFNNLPIKSTLNFLNMIILAINYQRVFKEKS